MSDDKANGSASDGNSVIVNCANCVFYAANQNDESQKGFGTCQGGLPQIVLVPIMKKSADIKDQLLGGRDDGMVLQQTFQSHWPTVHESRSCGQFMLPDEWANQMDERVAFLEEMARQRALAPQPDA